MSNIYNDNNIRYIWYVHTTKSNYFKAHQCIWYGIQRPRKDFLCCFVVMTTNNFMQDIIMWAWMKRQHQRTYPVELTREEDWYEEKAAWYVTNRQVSSKHRLDKSIGYVYGAAAFKSCGRGADLSPLRRRRVFNKCVEVDKSRRWIKLLLRCRL